ncbi:MAG: hypothetical protein OEV92_00365 [Nitrospinota bacterium]|nr:hypothetical protein [Nitrospinota bacterium]
MKRISLILVGLALAAVIGFGRVTPPAHAQAVNHDAIIAALQDMKQDINRMIQLVERHKAGTLAVGEETVTLSGAQLTQIINRYTTLKTGLAAKYQALP